MKHVPKNSKLNAALSGNRTERISGFCPEMTGVLGILGRATGAEVFHAALQLPRRCRAVQGCASLRPLRVWPSATLTIPHAAFEGKAEWKVPSCCVKM